MRAYLASPYASYLGSKDDAVWAAARSLLSIKGWLKPVLHLDEVAATDNCIWSPLIQGHFILWDRRGEWSESEALDWCLSVLETKFDTLVIANTIPRKDSAPNGMDREEKLARELSYPVFLETQFPI